LSAYVGAVAYGGSLGVLGSVIGVVAIFSPSFFLIAAVAPFYRALAGSDLFAHALGGANAAVVGLLAAAFVSPIWTTAIRAPADAVLAAAAFAALAFRWPNWLVVLLCAAAGFVFAF
jgi:chromate transporter